MSGGGFGERLIMGVIRPGRSRLFMMGSNHDPLDLVEADLIN
jgi:hypothetical protein